MDRGRTLAPVNCTRIEKVYLNSRLLTELAHPRISSGRPINYAFSHCSRNERSNPLDSASRLPARCFSSSSQISTRPGMGKKAKRTKIERGGGGDGKKRGRGNERRRGRRRRKRRRRISSTGAFLVVGPLPRFVSPLVAFTALKQWAYISWAAHACEIVLIYRWAITRSHILGSRLHVGLVTRAAQLSWRGAKRGADGKGEKIGGGRWDQPRFERGRRKEEGRVHFDSRGCLQR